MKDGVQYVLRFGGIASAEDTPAGADASKPQASSGMNCYLFVVASSTKARSRSPSSNRFLRRSRLKGRRLGRRRKGCGERRVCEKKDEVASADNEAEKPRTRPTMRRQPRRRSPRKRKPKLKAECERIEKENKRKEDDYQDKLKKGKERVEELNARLPAGTNVISDDVYKRSTGQRYREEEGSQAATGNDGAGTSPGRHHLPDSGECGSDHRGGQAGRRETAPTRGFPETEGWTG